MSYNKNNLESIIEEENIFWSNAFKNESKLLSGQNVRYTSYWWNEYYDEIRFKTKNILANFNNPCILEAGSGSGKASIVLGNEYDRTLLDISDEALRYAELLSEKFDAKNVKFVKGNIFNMPFDMKKFDFVWNIGVIEHYEPKHVEDILSEMLRVTKSGGYIAIGFPNFSSLPIIKAILLNYKIFKWIKGYRLGSEKRYKVSEIIEMFKSISNKSDRQVINSELLLIGNPLFMETPKFLIKTIGMFLELILPNMKFLKMVIFKVN